MHKFSWKKFPKRALEEDHHLPTRYDTLLFEADGKYGFRIMPGGKVHILAVYERIQKSGTIRRRQMAKLNGKFGVIDDQRRTVVPFEVVLRNSKTSVINLLTSVHNWL